MTFDSNNRGTASSGCSLDGPGVVDVWRNRLPHWQEGNRFVFVTWRLRDSLPQAKLEQWREERNLWLLRHPRPWDARTTNRFAIEFSRRIENWLDRGSGSCLLKDPALSRIVGDSLRHFDGLRYELASFVVMPNHVHVLFRPLGSHHLKNIVKSWKGFSAHVINRMIGESGRIWQKDYWDRLIRHPQHFLRCAEYIRENPEKAGLRDGEFLLFEKVQERR